MKIKIKSDEDLICIPTSIPSAKVIIQSRLIDVEKVYVDPELDDLGEPSYIIESHNNKGSFYHIPVSFTYIVRERGILARVKTFILGDK